MPALKAARLTKTRIESLKSGETLWDADVRGLACRCQKQRKVFVVRFRVGARQRWVTIGDYGAPWTIHTARHEAQRLLGSVRDGVPIERLRSASAADPTIADLCDRFMREHSTAHKKASSTRMDAANITNHVKPLLGRLVIRSVTRQDIEKFKLDVRDGKTANKVQGRRSGYRGGAVVTGGPGVANRCLALLSKMFNLAEIWGLRDEHTNPCRLVSKYRENRRQRFLSDEEIIRLGQTLDACTIDGTASPHAIAAIRLLLLTGARLSEILTAQWRHVDLERGYLTVPDSKTGPKVIFLNPAAVDILTALDRQADNPFVIVGHTPGSHLVNLRKPWHRMRGLAGLDEVRLHDLRHSFASIAASNGASLPLIGQLLGHTQPQTTQRYAHLAAKPVREANDAVGATLARLLSSPRTEF